MRVSKIGWFILLLIPLAVAAFFLYGRHNFHQRNQLLADGSTLRLAKVTFGKQERLNLAGFFEQLEDRLPPAWTARFMKSKPRNHSSFWQNTTMHSNDNALYIYLTRVDGTTGNYQSVDFSNVRLTADDGTLYFPTQSGGDEDGRLALTGTSPPAFRAPGQGYSVLWFRFEGFPRRQPQFQLQIFNDYQATNMVAQFTVHNPAPPPSIAQWSTRLLPVTNIYGNVSFILTDLNFKTNAEGRKYNFNYPRYVVPKFSIMESGQPSTNWEASDTELYDSSGNFATELINDERYLSPNESAWKLHVRFFGSELSQSASNTAWVLHDLAVPAPGKFTLLQSAHDLQGFPVKAVALVGTGDFVYHDGQPATNEPPAVPQTENSLTRTSGGRSGISDNYVVHGVIPHLMLQLGRLTDDQRLTVRVTDDQDRQFYAYQMLPYGPNRAPNDKPGTVRYLKQDYGQNDATFFALDIPADSKTVDISICLHPALISEFIFKPPMTNNLVAAH